MRELDSEEELDNDGVFEVDEKTQSMQPKLVADADVKIGKRLALTNMDWDNLTAVDIMAIFNSLCKGGEMFIRRVEILPSLYGIEQMKNDTLYGPPQALFDTDADATQQSKKKRKNKASEMIDEDINTEAFDQNQLRKYEMNKMKYFYAVIHCNSSKTAERIYSEYNDYEFELSNIRLNLSFIADDLEFPQAIKESVSEVPPDYEFKASNSLNRALNHTQVKLTWDETDPKRLRKFQRIMDADPDEIDEDEYKEFLASGTEDEEVEEDEIAHDKDKVEEYRQKLLGCLSDSKADPFRKRNLQQSDEESGDEEGEGELNIKFNVGFGEDVGEKLIKQKKYKKDKARETAWESYQRKRKEKKKEKKEQAKSTKDAIKKKGFGNPEEVEQVTEK